MELEVATFALQAGDGEVIERQGKFSIILDSHICSANSRRFLWSDICGI